MSYDWSWNIRVYAATKRRDSMCASFMRKTRLPCLELLNLLPIIIVIITLDGIYNYWVTISYLGIYESL